MFLKRRQKLLEEAGMDQDRVIKHAGNSDSANDTKLKSPGQTETQEKNDSVRASVAAADGEGELPVHGREQLEERTTAAQETPPALDPPSGASVEGVCKAKEDRPVKVPESIVSLSRYTQLKAEKEELYQQLLRLQAEFENFRKRTQREKQDFFDYALADFLHKLLPVLDGFERGLFAPEGETVENFKTGFQLILKQFRDVLIQAGLEPIPTSSRFFDPNYHQALMREETEAFADNEIISEMQRGYAFKGRLLRPSLVKVAAAPEKVTTLSNPAEDVSDRLPER